MEHRSRAATMRRNQDESGEPVLIHVQLGGSGHYARQHSPSRREAGGEPGRLRGGLSIRGHSERDADLVFQVFSGGTAEIPGV